MNDITAHILVPHDHPSLAGHFPGHPIVPGVVLLDEVLDAIRSASTRTLTLVSVVSTKFLRAVEPGTELELQVKFSADASGSWKARFAATHAGASVLEGNMLIATVGEGAS